MVRFEAGWCPVDVLLEPSWNHGGYCESDIRLHWEDKVSDPQVLLDTISERICHMPLDQEEIAAGESDVAMSECRHLRYLMQGEKMTKIFQQETDGTCHFE
jgi:hypothetical protein